MRTADGARTALGVIRLANGLIALAAPERLTRRFADDGRTNGTAVYVLRMFGVRTILLGVALLRRGDRSDELRRAPIIHATDTAAALLAGLRGHLPRRAALTGTVISGINTALAVAARRGALQQRRSR